MSTVLVLLCILTSGSVSFAGSARAVVAEHAFTRTKVRCRSLLPGKSVAGDIACAVSAWPVVHSTSESGEGGLEWEEVYQKQGPLPAGGLEMPLCQDCARDPSDNCGVSARACVTVNCILLHCE